jgi:hypothetical protein
MNKNKSALKPGAHPVLPGMFLRFIGKAAALRLKFG